MDESTTLSSITSCSIRLLVSIWGFCRWRLCSLGVHSTTDLILDLNLFGENTSLTRVSSFSSDQNVDAFGINRIKNEAGFHFAKSVD